ncbi:MAG: DUF1857 family protein [Rhodocyclaceae bacterium]|nr:MAG: DUF1857 family protein [Rhodocyclaceae bacterium]
MRFEHLIEINDPKLPFLIPLTRAQLWAGLMLRVEDSRPFLPGLDECRIVRRSEGMVERALRWGEVEVWDRVTFEAETWVRFDTPPSAHHGGGLLTITIEEPEPERLFLRFLYETMFASGHETEDAGYADYLRQAYEAAGIDTVQRIRELAESASRH